MATAPQTVRPAPTTPKQETYVEEQLARALQRIRRLDTLAALLGLGSLTLLYALVMTLLDRWLFLPALARLAALGLYGLATGVYLWFTLVRPWLRPINPYYAARMLESALPGSKNSVVNWLDLRAQKLPAAIRNAVSARAAKDVARADVDAAVSGRRVGRVAGSTAVLAVAMIVYLVICQPMQFFSLLRRTFVPFVEGAVATRTTLAVVHPVTPIAVVPLNQAVNFEIELGGREPRAGQADAPCLHFRYSQSEPVYQERPFEPGDRAHAWTFRMPIPEVHNGFFYYLSVGDARTAEFQVRAVSGPLVTSFDVTYHHRPYLARPDDRTNNPNLEGLRGTTVTLTAHTNRFVRDGQLVIAGEPTPIEGKTIVSDPEALQFQFVLDKGESYRIRFNSTEGEASNDSTPFSMKILHDQTPQVELKKPIGDVTLPLNGVLPLEGAAGDDFGVVSLTLHAKVVDGPKLQPKPYRLDEKKSFQFADGSYPRMLDYYDVFDLTKVKDESGKAVTFKEGQVVEYWLESADACDYPPPGPNVGRTPRSYKIKLGPVEQNPEKNQDQRQQAEKRARQQQRQQDQQHAQEQRGKRRTRRATGGRSSWGRQRRAPPPRKETVDAGRKKEGRGTSAESGRTAEEGGRTAEEARKP